MISIIIPIYNESESIPSLLASLEKNSPSFGLFEIIFVDDGSSDNSFELLTEAAKHEKAYKVIRFVRNTGQTAAMQAGINHAKGDILVFMDADLQNDPADIQKLLEKLNEGYDVVSGWRKDRQDNPIKRNLPSYAANYIISKVSGVHLHDYGCTLKAYKAKVIKNVRLYGEMHRFIPIYAVWQGAKIAEIPVVHHARKFGQSKYGLERIFKVILDICVIKFLDRYLAKPIYIFGGFGLLSFLISFLAFILAFYLKFISGISFVQTPLPLFASFAFLTGIIFVLMGLLGEIMSRTYYESKQSEVYIIKETINIDSNQDEYS